MNNERLTTTMTSSWPRVSLTTSGLVVALALVTLTGVPSISGECTCDVRFVGEYCGMVLNEKTGGNCSNDMYFCGKSNLHKEGVILKTCVQRGFECDKKLNGGNACYQNVKCLCGPNLNRKRKYCGTDLTGPDCQPNIVYRCPMIRRYNPSPEDACPFGCKDGVCLDG